MTRWVNFRKNTYINMNCNYSTTIWESIFAQIYIFLVEQYFFQFLLINVSRSKAKVVKNTYIQKYIYMGLNTHPYCSWITVVLVNGDILSKIHKCHNTVNGIKPGSN